MGMDVEILLRSSSAYMEELVAIGSTAGMVAMKKEIG